MTRSAGFEPLVEVRSAGDEAALLGWLAVPSIISPHAGRFVRFAVEPDRPTARTVAIRVADGWQLTGFSGSLRPFGAFLDLQIERLPVDVLLGNAMYDDHELGGGLVFRVTCEQLVALRRVRRFLEVDAQLDARTGWPVE